MSDTKGKYYASNIVSVKEQTVIVVVSKCGKGIEDDPIRHITQYFSIDGTLLATVDTWEEE